MKDKYKLDEFVEYQGSEWQIILLGTAEGELKDCSAIVYDEKNEYAEWSEFFNFKKLSKNKRFREE